MSESEYAPLRPDAGAGEAMSGQQTRPADGAAAALRRGSTPVVEDHWQMDPDDGGAPSRRAAASAGSIVSSVAGSVAASTVVVQRLNHDPIKAFFEDKFVEEGYVHRTPPPTPPTPFDSTRRGVIIALLAPSILLLGLDVCAHSGWWTVDVALSTNGTDATTKSTTSVLMGDTANFRAATLCLACCNYPCIAASMWADIVYLELATSTVRGVTDSERLARYIHMSWTRRCQFIAMGIWLTHVAAFPPTEEPRLQIVVQISVGGIAIMVGLLGAFGMKYFPVWVITLGPHVLSKTSLRAEYAQRTRDFVLAALLSACVCARVTSYFLLHAEWWQLGGSESTRVDSSWPWSGDAVSFSGRSQCELNLAALPVLAFLLMTFQFSLRTTGFTLRGAFEKMQISRVQRNTGVVTMVLVVPHACNAAALWAAYDGVVYCDALAIAVWAPWLVIATVYTGVVFPAMIGFVLDQRCNCKCIRKVLPRPAVFKSIERLYTEVASGSGVRLARWELRGEFAAFLSHYKIEAAGDARHLKDALSKLLGAPIFLDSDDLTDLRELLRIVARSDVFLLLQTTNVLTRPWCLLEIFTAIKNHVPIVPISIKGGFPYSHSDASVLLSAADSTFAAKLDRRSPGSVAIIRKHQIPVRGVFMDVDIEQIGKTLLEHLPNLLSKQFEPSASRIVIEAQLEDLAQAMEQVRCRSNRSPRESVHVCTSSC